MAQCWAITIATPNRTEKCGTMLSEVSIIGSQAGHEYAFGWRYVHP
jgi:hypothetical protein